MRLSFNTEWKNKKWGMIERRNQDDTLLHFVETTNPRSTNPYQYMSPPSEKYPVLAEGIIAFYLCNQGRNNWYLQ
jgi:hypothetical protein